MATSVGKSTSYFEQLRDALQALVDDSVLVGASSLSVAITSLGTFRDGN